MNLSFLRSMKSFFAGFLIFAAFYLQAQKTTYHLPAPIQVESMRLVFDKVSVSSSSYYVNYEVENTANGYLVIDRKRTSLKQDQGELFPTSDQYVVPSGASKKVYNQFRVKAPFKPYANMMHLNLGGFRYSKPFEPVAGEKLNLAEGATMNFGKFSVKVMEYNVYQDRVYANIKCSFGGEVDDLGKIDLSNMNVTGGKADVVKKGDVVFPGKTYSFSINITPDGTELNVNFAGVFSVSQLERLALKPLEIRSTDYEAAAPEKEVEKEQEEKKEEVLNELSFADFMSLRKDIELEMNSGGKPVEMAHEFLLEKGSISTAQVVEVLSVFNLDGKRLHFAKMAYAFTTDKVKYHTVVGKLAYTKNKQALEEFLSHR